MTTRGTIARTMLAGSLVLGLGLAAGRAHAATACGTIITNVATATMTSGFPDFVAYAVSYNATCTVAVLCPPVVRLVKWATTPMCAAGCTVTFQVCIENQMTDTVWGITMTDALPGNMTFVAMGSQVPLSVVANYDTTLGGPFVLGAVVGSSASTTAGPWNAGGPTVGQAPVWYLRWVVPGIGPAKSACVTYAARIL